MNYFVVIVIILMAGRVSIKRVYTRLTGGNTGYDNRVKLRYNKLKPLNYRAARVNILKKQIIVNKTPEHERKSSFELFIYNFWTI